MGKTKTVLFVCVGNAARSQMAQGFANYYGKGKVVAMSAGIRPASKVSEGAIRAMEEVGVDISKEMPKKLTQDMAKKADVIITMGCRVEDECPAVFLKNAIDWGLEDPKGKGLDEVRRIREEIKSRVLELIGTLQ